VYGAPLSGAPRSYLGVVFRPYRAGIARYVLVSDDFRIEVRRHDATYEARADGKTLCNHAGNLRRFRAERTAAEAGVTAILRKEARQ